MTTLKRLVIWRLLCGNYPRLPNLKETLSVYFFITFAIICNCIFINLNVYLCSKRIVVTCALFASIYLLAFTVLGINKMFYRYMLP